MTRTKAILSRRHIPTLTGFALSNVLLAFDYDGTLAPLARSPERARMRRSTRELLARVAHCYPCVVISGRALDDVTQRLKEIPLWYVFGNHGLEPAASAGPRLERTRDWIARLRQQLPDDPGVIIEDKRHSLTIHYRRAIDRARTLAALERVLPTLPDARIISGAEAVNVLPRHGPTKGVALRQALRLFACDTAIYVGDDETDEDAFASGRPGQVLGIRVAPGSSTRAQYHLGSQREIDRLLQVLLALRVPRYGSRPPVL